MRVLVVEGTPGASVHAVRELERAGHEVRSCHDEGHASFPCRGMVEGGRCPLEGESVDVALLVRVAATHAPTAEEEGVRCALRRHVPVAIVGEVADVPYADWATVIRPGADDIVGAAEAAAAAPLARHTSAARHTLRTVLAGNGLPTELAEAVVERHGNHLHVLLSPGVAMDPMVADTASVRTVGAVRAVDPYAGIIDVSVEQPSTLPCC
jgi:hypothetical protein